MPVRVCVGLLAVVAVSTLTGGAALAGLDDLEPFGGSIGDLDPPMTLDTRTGLIWLDVDQTTNLSFNEMRQALLPGGAFFGFRHATVDEVLGLLETAEVPDIDTDPTFANFLPLQGLLELIGVTQSSTSPVPLDSVLAFTADVEGSFVRAPKLTVLTNDGEGEALFTGGNTLLDPGFKSPAVGHFLVEGAIPAPGAALSLAAGLLGLATRRRRSGDGV